MAANSSVYTDRDVEMITFIFEVRPKLTDFEAKFMNDILDALKTYSRKALMSQKQRKVVRRCYDKARIWPLKPFPLEGD